MRKILQRIIVLGLAISLCFGSTSLSYAKAAKTSKKETVSNEKSDTDYITKEDIYYLQNVNSIYARSVIKDAMVIDTYAKCKKLLKKLEKRFVKENPKYMVENDSLYSTLKAYDKTYFKKKSVCIYAYDIADTGKMVDSPKFSIENVEDKKSAVLTVTRRNHLGGIDVSMVSYYFVNVKKNKIKGVTDYISKEIEYVPGWNENELQHAWSMSSLFTKANDHVISPIYTTNKFLHSNQEWIEEGMAIIKSYKQYKNKILSKKDVPDELKGYDKKFFKKYNLVVDMYCAFNGGIKPRAVTHTKEIKDGKTSLVITYVRYPYYGGTDDVNYYCYVAETSKKDVKDVDSYEIRELSLFDKIY